MAAVSKATSRPSDSQEVKIASSRASQNQANAQSSTTRLAKNVQSDKLTITSKASENKSLSSKPSVNSIKSTSEADRTLKAAKDLISSYKSKTSGADFIKPIKRDVYSFLAG
ncbi:MAG: hypothetical protein HW421_54 [Ignavibacteria bacterium]|nr:hypothetical protein [Ignavibacteria bacterium]